MAERKRQKRGSYFKYILDPYEPQPRHVGQDHLPAAAPQEIDPGQAGTENIERAGSATDSSDSSATSTDNESESTDDEDGAEGFAAAEMDRIAGRSTLSAPVFPESPLNVGNVLALVLQFHKRHRTSRVSVEDQLLMLKAILDPLGHGDFPSTWFSLQKNLSETASAATQHFLCPQHQLLLRPDEDRDVLICPSDLSEFRKSNDDLNKCSFWTISMRSGLSGLLREHGSRIFPLKERTRESPITDIVDGLCYQELRRKLNMGPDDLTLLFHGDAASPFKGKSAISRTCYLLHYSIIELPPSIRKRSMLLHTVAFGESTPSREQLLIPFLDEVQDLMDDGIEYDCCGIPKRSRIFPVVCSCDSAERFKLLNLASYSGYYGCTTCSIMGEYHGSIVYPYAPNIPLRRHVTTVRLGLEAASVVDDRQFDLRRHYFQGVRGPTVFARLRKPSLLFPKSFPSDFLHLICEGVLKRMLKYWMKKLAVDLNEVNRRMAELRLNFQAKRQPRDLDHISKMSATELLFILLFGIPIFNGLVPYQYLKHFSLLVRGSLILLSDELSTDKIASAHQNLTQFVAEFRELYGIENMVYNVHQLTHFALDAENWGPVSGFWTFELEGKIGSTLRRLHGCGRFTAKEIVNSALLEMSTGTLDSEYGYPKNAPQYDRIAGSLKHPHHRARGLIVRNSDYSQVCLFGAKSDCTTFRRDHPDLWTDMQPFVAGIPSSAVTFTYKAVMPNGFTVVGSAKQKGSRKVANWVWTGNGLFNVCAFCFIKNGVNGEVLVLGRYHKERFVQELGYSRLYPYFFQMGDSTMGTCVRSDEILNSVIAVTVDGVTFGTIAPNCLNVDL